jgi:hypothetical protein
MAIVRPATAATHAGLYAWLADREEAEFRGWADSPHARLPGGYPSQRIIDDLRAGRPVTVRRNEVPARFGLSGPPRERDDPERWRMFWESVTVHADGRVAGVDGPGLSEYAEL